MKMLRLFVLRPFQAFLLAGVLASLFLGPLVFTACWSAEKEGEGRSVKNQEEHETKHVEGRFDDLAQHFLKALQARNPTMAMKCWVTPDLLKPVFAKAVRNGVMKPEAQQEWEKNTFPGVKRNVSLVLPELHDALKENGYDPGKLTLLKTYGNVTITDVASYADHVNIILRYDATTTIRLMIDVGIKIDGKWYLEDRPSPFMLVMKNGVKHSMLHTKTLQEKHQYPKSILLHKKEGE